ncbi:hypothetical protein ACQBAU_18485 [Propionibacteriaceae bacterium Y2011]
MDRRTFLTATSLAAAAAGLAQLPGVASAAPRQPAGPGPSGDPLVSTRVNEWLVAGVGTPAMDGTLADPTWGEPARTGLVTPWAQLPLDADVTTHVRHDASHLHVGLRYAHASAATVTACWLIVRPASHGGRYWSKRISVRPQEAEDDLVFRWGGSPTDLADLQHEHAAGDSEVTITARIPYAALGVGRPAPGSTWQLNLVVEQQINAAAWGSLAPFRSSIIDRPGNNYIHLDLVNHAAAMPVVFAESPTAIPTTPALEYVGHTTKRVTLDPVVLDPRTGRPRQGRSALSLTWRSPHASTPITPTSIGTVAGATVVTFDHPAPDRDGQYGIALEGTAGTCTLTFDRHDLLTAGDQLPGNLPRPSSGGTAVAPGPSSPSAATLQGLIPETAGMLFCRLPHNPGAGTSGRFSWSPSAPDVITSRDAASVRYPNADHPEDQSVTVTNRLGDPVTHHFHRDAEGREYYLSGQLDYLKKQYVYGQLPIVAAADPLGAARVLVEFAARYQTWAPTNDFPDFNRPMNWLAAPQQYFGGLLNRWSISELEGLQSIGECYRLIEQTDAFDVLADEVGFDVRERLWADLFQPSLDFFHSFTKQFTNYDFPSYLGLVSLGRARGDSAPVHEAMEWLRTYAAGQYRYDGWFSQVTSSYHMQSNTGLDRVLTALEGWSDGPDYESPRSGERFDGLDAAGAAPQLALAQRIARELVYPDAKFFPFNDTWAFTSPAGADITAGSLLYGGGGVARLQRGELVPGGGIEEVSQLYVSFAAKSGHSHYEPLGIALFAAGQELLPDLGYTHTILGRWAVSALSHNTVVVDAANMVSTGEDVGSLQGFSEPATGVQLIRVDRNSAYPATSLYSRECWHLGIPGAAANAGYVLDVFRVRGGERHEYTFNGDANRDATITTEPVPAPYGPYLLPEGVEPVLPVNEFDEGSAGGHYHAYMHIRDVSRAELADGRFAATIKTSDEGTPGAGLAVHGVAPSGTELFVGEAPSLRVTRTGSGTQDDTRPLDFFMPKVVLRREGTDLNSDFITVFEPHGAGATGQVHSVEQLPITGGADGDIAVKVTHDGGHDIMISSLDDTRTLMADGVTLTGRYGLARFASGQPSSLHLVGGTALAAGELTVSGPGAVTGDVVTAKRKTAGDEVDAFVTTAAVPEWVIGKVLVIKHADDTTHSYRVTAVTASGGQTMIELDTDPGLIVSASSASLVFFPRTTWDGATTFRIDNDAST